MDNDRHKIGWILDSIRHFKKNITIVYFKIHILIICWKLQPLQLFKNEIF